MRLGSNLLAAAIAAALALLLPLAAPAQMCPPALPAGASGSQSLRLMTYNVFILSFPADNADKFGEHTQAERAELIAERILADDPDVVVLNEADPNDAKWKFIEVLADNGPYKSYVQRIDRRFSPLLNSGLMLFSKHPFGLPDTTVIGTEDTCEAWNNGEPFDHGCSRAVFGHDQTNDLDWWQNKGVGLVRILNTCNGGAPFNVGFSHTQSKGSSEDDDCVYSEDVSDLQEQLATIRALWEQSFNAGSLLTQPNFMLGDLNVDGNQVGANRVTSKDRPYALLTSGPDAGPSIGSSASEWTCDISPDTNEWELIFNSLLVGGNVLADDLNSGFYACRGNQLTSLPCTHTGADKSGSLFVDTWAYNTSSQDPGQTHHTTGGGNVFTDPDSGERLDYILHNEPRSAAPGVRTLCAQWIRRGFRNGTNELSDHLPLTADFNFPAPRCTMRPRQKDDPNLEPGDDPEPLGPEPVVFDLANPKAPNFKDVLFPRPGELPVETLITNPGNMQWYVLDQQINVEISATGGVAFEVYQARDLSRPVGGAMVECAQDPDARTQKCKYTLTEPPYYVRVFGADGADPKAENRNTFGPYIIKFHRFDCSSMAEACGLKPGVAIRGLWPEGPLGDADNDDTMWFWFLSEKAKSGTFPAVDFRIQHSFGNKFSGQLYWDPLTPSLVNRAGALVCSGVGCAAGGFASQSPAPVPASTQVTWSDTGDGFKERIAAAVPESLPGVRSWPDKYFLKLARFPGYVDDLAEQRVTMRTTLTYFRPQEMLCKIERTDVGPDDIASKWSYGGEFDSMRQLGDDNGDFETWTDGSRMKEAGTQGAARTPFPFELDVSFVGDGADAGEALTTDLYEDVLDEDNYRMCTIDQGGTCWNVYYFGKGIAALSAAAADPPDSDAVFQWRDESEDPDYHYVLTYRLRHERMPCRGTAGPAASDCPEPGTICSDSDPKFTSYTSSPRCVCVADAGCPPPQTCNIASGLCQFP